jgi:hypothetical protein
MALLKTTYEEGSQRMDHTKPKRAQYNSAPKTPRLIGHQEAGVVVVEPEDARLQRPYGEPVNRVEGNHCFQRPTGDRPLFTTFVRRFRQRAGHDYCADRCKTQEPVVGSKVPLDSETRVKAQRDVAEGDDVQYPEYGQEAASLRGRIASVDDTRTVAHYTIHDGYLGSFCVSNSFAAKELPYV